MKRSYPGFSLSLPAAWDDLTEKGSSTFAFGPRDGVGVLQFSIGLYESGTPPEITLDELMEMLVEFGAKRQFGAGFDMRIRHEAPFSIGMSFSTKGRRVRAWYISDGSNAALATYNCRTEEVGLEMDECEDVVASLRFGSV